MKRFRVIIELDTPIERKALNEEALDAAHQLVSAIWNKTGKKPVLIYAATEGVDIETVHKAKEKTK